MKLQKMMVPAVMFASLSCGFAGEAPALPNAKPALSADLLKEAAMEARANRPHDMREAGRPGGGRRQDMRIAEGLDEMGPQSMLIRMFEDPNAVKEMGLTPEVQATIAESFKKADAQINAKRAELKDLQRNQAKLMADRAKADEVMAAVDKAWACRAEIAKLQTGKVLELRSHLTDDQINNLDKVRREQFRTRRMRQLQDGEGKDMRGPHGQRPEGNDRPGRGPQDESSANRPRQGEGTTPPARADEATPPPPPAEGDADKPAPPPAE